jgi:hypothetical protein
MGRRKLPSGFETDPSKICPSCFKTIVAYSMGVSVFLSNTIPEI